MGGGVVLSPIWFGRIRLSLADSCRVLSRLIEFYRVLSIFTKFYKVPTRPVKSCKVLPRPAESCRVLLEAQTSKFSGASDSQTKVSGLVGSCVARRAGYSGRQRMGW